MFYKQTIPGPSQTKLFVLKMKQKCHGIAYNVARHNETCFAHGQKTKRVSDLISVHAFAWLLKRNLYWKLTAEMYYRSPVNAEILSVYSLYRIQRTHARDRKMRVRWLFIQIVSFRTHLRLRDIFVLSATVWFFHIFFFSSWKRSSRSIVPLRSIIRFALGCQTNSASPTVVFCVQDRARRGTFPSSLPLPFFVKNRKKIKLVLFHDAWINIYWNKFLL